MRTADLKTDGTVYRASPGGRSRYSQYEVDVVLLDLNGDTPEEWRGRRYKSEKRPIQARVVAPKDAAGNIVWLSARLVLKTREQHDKEVAQAEADKARWAREKEEGIARNTPIAAELNALQIQLGLTHEAWQGEIEPIIGWSVDQYGRLAAHFRGYGSDGEKLLDRLREFAALRETTPTEEITT